MATKEGMRRISLTQPKVMSKAIGHQNDAMSVGDRAHIDQQSKQ